MQPAPIKSVAGKTRQGFTLIELLTVVAIVGILASIIIPTVGKVRESARSSQCASNLRQGCIALRLYANDNKGLLPPAYAPVVPPSVRSLDWAETLAPYLPLRASNARNAVLQCASSGYREQMDGAGFTDPNQYPVARTYALGPGSAGLNSSNTETVSGLSRNLSAIKNPSLAVWLLESKLELAANVKNGLAHGQIGKSQFYTSITAPTTTTNDLASPVSWPHGGKNRTNVGFGDASVRAYTARELVDRYPDANTDAGWQRVAGF